MQIFCSKITHLKERNTAYINFRQCFWDRVKPPSNKNIKPQYVIGRVYFFEQKSGLYMSFKDPIFLPMYRLYIRNLQSSGRDLASYKVNIPIQLVKKYNLKRYNIVNLHRIKGYSGLVHKCIFERDPNGKRKPAIIYSKEETKIFFDDMREDAPN